MNPRTLDRVEVPEKKTSCRRPVRRHDESHDARRRIRTSSDKNTKGNSEKTVVKKLRHGNDLLQECNLM